LTRFQLPDIHFKHRTTGSREEDSGQRVRGVRQHRTGSSSRRGAGSPSRQSPGSGGRGGAQAVLQDVVHVPGVLRLRLAVLGHVLQVDLAVPRVSTADGPLTARRAIWPHRPTVPRARPSESWPTSPPGWPADLPARMSCPSAGPRPHSIHPGRGCPSQHPQEATVLAASRAIGLPGRQQVSRLAQRGPDLLQAAGLSTTPSPYQGSNHLPGRTRLLSAYGPW